MKQHNIAVTITAIIVTFVMTIIIWKKDAFGHPDGATPYWYPATYIYGFVEGCWKTVEENQTLAKSMWPDDIRAVCGCAIDAVRHAMPYHEAESPNAETRAKFDFITQGVLPQCIMEVEASIMLRNGEK